MAAKWPLLLPLTQCMLVAVLVCVQHVEAGAHREHKVHNIVLYPDKHSWCRTTTIKQVISYPGCRSVEIDNNVCVGACFSYSIPHTEPSDPGEVIVPYCDSCQPSETTWNDVTLDCQPGVPLTSSAAPQPAADSASTGAKSNASPSLSVSFNSAGAGATPPQQLVKRVQIITNCSCAPCERSIGSAHGVPSSGATPSSPHRSATFPSAAMATVVDSMLLSASAATSGDVQSDALAYEVPLNDGPDLLNVLQLRNSTLQMANGGGDAAATGGSASGGSGGVQQAAPEHLRKLMNNKIVSLLQRIQETNQSQDKQQLKELLQMIQDPEDNETGPDDHPSGVTPLTWSDAAFAEFVERLADEHVELDVGRLREVLHKFERSQAYKEYRRREQELEEQRQRERHQQLLDKHQHDKALHQLERQLQNQPPPHSPPVDARTMADNLTNRSDSDQSSGRIDAMPDVSRQLREALLANSATTPSTTTAAAAVTPAPAQHPHAHHAAHHHHVVGEHLGNGRLVKGPHGALIIEPDVVAVVQHERLDVSPTELKANHAGTMLSYGGSPSGGGGATILSPVVAAPPARLAHQPVDDA